MQITAEIIAEIIGQVGAGGEFDGATIFVNIGKWCAERIFRDLEIASILQRQTKPGKQGKKNYSLTTQKTVQTMITYKIVEKKKPGTQDFKYYGQIATVKPMGIRELCKKVAARCTATSSDIKAVIDALEYEIIEAVKDGKSVRLGTLGSFRPTVKGEGAESAATWAPSMLKSVNVRVTAGSGMKSELNVRGGGVTFGAE